MLIANDFTRIWNKSGCGRCTRVREIVDLFLEASIEKAPALFLSVDERNDSSLVKRQEDLQVDWNMPILVTNLVKAIIYEILCDTMVSNATGPIIIKRFYKLYGS